VERTFPAGIGRGRQSVAVQQLSAWLYGSGLSYQSVRMLLTSVGCKLSHTTIRNNVIAVRADAREPLTMTPLRLFQATGSRLSGPDGEIHLSLGGTQIDRWAEVAVGAGPGATEIRWRLETAARCLRLF
jgi:hypothetical protein